MTVKFSTAFLSTELKKAVKEAKRKQVVDKFVFDAMSFDNKLRSFSIAGDITNRSIAQVQRLVHDSISRGETFDQFKKKMSPGIIKNITSPHVVYNQAANNVYQKARFNKAQELKILKPFLQYLTFGDERVRPNHAVMHGTVAAQDSPFWKNNYPPNGFRCRCTASAIGTREVLSGKTRRRDLTTNIGGKDVTFKASQIRVETTKQINSRVLKQQLDAGVPKGKIAKPLADKKFRGSFTVNDPVAQNFIKSVARLGIADTSSLFGVAQRAGGRQFQEIEKNHPAIRDPKIFQQTLPNFINNDLSYFEFSRDKLEFRQTDIYKTYARKSVLGDLRLTPQMDIAMETVRNPVAVFRDYRRISVSRETFYEEHYIGLFKNSKNEKRISYVIARRNLLVNSVFTKISDQEKIFSRIVGVLVFQKNLLKAVA